MPKISSISMEHHNRRSCRSKLPTAKHDPKVTTEQDSPHSYLLLFIDVNNPRRRQVLRLSEDIHADIDIVGRAERELVVREAMVRWHRDLCPNT
jgi:hypothetical protein